jgi:son of sevenless-like protein
MVLAFHSEEIARQLTLIEFELFQKIKPWEFLGLQWNKKDKDLKAPNILAMIQRFNQVQKNSFTKDQSHHHTDQVSNR